ncbi:mitochondrial external alternative NADH-ubiquinone oxidoreductase [Drechslerella stenobrocha 248]|uniref:NADH:ubiquinone reductase (non-electrogenic) n=1 Tax=Drechslerella stenobrocha 248 TaxID=1043628 RepID=W7IH84_9PEZI|nr:mitochondrial external alternative NADH-ubiquinone oxidoreductase [Drechslerella stenobrocha 248]
MVLRTPSAAAARRSILQSSLQSSSRCLARRPLSAPTLSALRPLGLPSRLSAQSYRPYATEVKAATSSSPSSAAAAVGGPAQLPKRRFGVLRFLWRLTWISALGSFVYLGYHIYDSKHPPEQLPLDPTKKTLVVLGSGWGSVSLLKKLDTENYNVVVISPRNFFLFTPLLPSCTTGTIEHRSIMEPLRHIIRHKKRAVQYYEAEATKIDAERRVVKMSDSSDVKGNVSETEVPFDYLVIGVGAENATFGIPGVKENACFLKEIQDAQRIRTRVMDCIETATFKDQTDEEKARLLHMVIVGGGPTGIEFAGELHDFFEEDLRKWVPDISEKFRVTLVEALPNVLPMFSKALIEYTEKTFKDENILVRTKTMVKKVTDRNIEVEVTQPDGNKYKETIPYGLLVWATGNAVRGVVRDLMSQLPAQKNSRRGLAVNDYLVVDGTEGIWALGDCSVTKYAPTAQVASQQGNFLARLFNSMAKTQAIEEDLFQLDQMRESAADEAEKAKLAAEIEVKGRSLSRIKQLSPFEYSHQGSLAYIGADRAVADINWFGGVISSATGGELTYLFWRSAYVSMVFSLRNRILVLTDWFKTKAFGRDGEI